MAKSSFWTKDGTAPATQRTIEDILADLVDTRAEAAASAADALTQAVEAANQSTAASAARTAAEAAQAAAEFSQVEAAASQATAATEAATATTQRLAAEAAQSAALAARGGAETAQGLAETAQAAAEQAELDAIAEKMAAITARQAAETAQAAAEAAQAGAEANLVAAGFPTVLIPTDAAKLLQVKADGSGYELTPALTAAQLASSLDLSSKTLTFPNRNLAGPVAVLRNTQVTVSTFGAYVALTGAITNAGQGAYDPLGGFNAGTWVVPFAGVYTIIWPCHGYMTSWSNYVRVLYSAVTRNQTSVAGTHGVDYNTITASGTTDNDVGLTEIKYHSLVSNFAWTVSCNAGDVFRFFYYIEGSSAYIGAGTNITILKQG